MEESLTIKLHQARAGSKEALDVLFERVAGRLLALIRLRLGRQLRARLESRDILQVSLLRAFQRLDQLQGDDSGALMAWLARIAENEIRDQADFHGRQRRDAARDVPLEDPALGGLAERIRSQASRLILDEEAERLEQALETLDESYREVILLRKFEELSFEEVGRRMGRSPDACRMLLARALTALTLAVEGPP
jgi:RNA polymerase sigma-70 factor (ECF subfamily)